VFLDESGVNTGMTRLYGRSKGSKRVVDYVPDVRYQRTSILSSVRLDGTIVPLTFTGALNGELFVKYITEFLVPTLKKGDIVVMDNLSSHKVNGVIQPIVASGATVLYLPPYSPDFNPIEMMWSKIKAYLRKVKARTPDMLFNTIGEAFNYVSISDISSWFLKDGYSIR
jgi:transposase